MYFFVSVQCFALRDGKVHLFYSVVIFSDILYAMLVSQAIRIFLRGGARDVAQGKIRMGTNDTVLCANGM